MDTALHPSPARLGQCSPFPACLGHTSLACSSALRILRLNSPSLILIFLVPLLPLLPSSFSLFSCPTSALETLSPRTEGSTPNLSSIPCWSSITSRPSFLLFFEWHKRSCRRTPQHTELPPQLARLEPGTGLTPPQQQQHPTGRHGGRARGDGCWDRGALPTSAQEQLCQGQGLEPVVPGGDSTTPSSIQLTTGTAFCPPRR